LEFRIGSKQAAAGGQAGTGSGQGHEDEEFLHGGVQDSRLGPG
jgi:hypothetical protein